MSDTRSITVDSIKTFYIACSGKSWLYAAEILQHDAGWEPLYWVGHESEEAEIKKISPQVVFHELISAVRGINPLNETEVAPGIIDEPLLLEFARNESLLMKMMDRMDPGNAFTYGERVEFYHSLLRYWLGVIQEFRPKIIVFPESPHMVFDYVLYTLCKKYDIRTPMFESLLPMGWVMPMDSVENGCTVIKDEYTRRFNSKKLIHSYDLNLSTLEFASRLRGDQKNAVLIHVKKAIEQQSNTPNQPGYETILEKLKHVNKYPRYVIQAVSEIYRTINRLHHHITDPPPPNYLKQKGRSIQASNMTGLEWRTYKMKANRYKRRLKKEYEELAGDVGSERNYIFAALQYQPEKTSSPDGGVFVQQELIVQMLSSCIPRNWYVYVKENPGQFGKWHGERSREINFYRSLASISNVRLVPMNIPTYDMIDGSRAVATIRGTAGLEGIMRGKPALLFGKPWYQGCEGTFEVRSLNKCREALKKIEVGYVPEEKKVFKFLRAAENTAVRGFVSEKYGLSLGISSEQNGRIIADTLHEFVSRNTE